MGPLQEGAGRRSGRVSGQPVLKLLVGNKGSLEKTTKHNRTAGCSQEGLLSEVGFLVLI